MANERWERTAAELRAQNARLRVRGSGTWWGGSA
jgi:hypothetical protein